VLIASIIYNYIKTEEYKEVLIVSFIIGAILGCIYGIITIFTSILSANGSKAPYGLIIIVSLILIIAYVFVAIILAIWEV